jgi:hypothetical protein
MNLHRKYKNLGIALGILAVYIVTAAVLFYPGSTGLGTFFNFSVLLILTYNIAIAAGIVLLLLRLLKWYKDKLSLIYILTGTLNIFLAFSGFVLYFFEKADMAWLHNSIGNLFIGFLMYADIFFLLPAKD